MHAAVPTDIRAQTTSRTDALALRIITIGRAILIGISIAIAGYLSCGGFESYCFIWPAIDTKFAPGFSERKFAKVEVGMTREQVVAIIGQPLGTGAFSSAHPAYKVRGDEVWTYSQDGAAPWGDWAWLSREVIFRDGRVVQKVFWTFYD